MTAPRRTPYEDTAVSVERSKETIRRLLKATGALGVQFDEEWSEPPRYRIRFIWPIEGLNHVIRLEVSPLPPEPLSRGSGWRISPEQRERQAWRGLAHYLDGTIKAAEFGLIRFEDIFLSFIETTSGTTVGEALIPRLTAGPLQLEAGRP
jgi:hypothetical protein